MEEITACGAVIVDAQRRVFVARRGGGKDAAAAGHWEFPGGKPEAGETHEEALRREIREELGAEISVGQRLATGSFAQPSRKVTVHFFAARLTGGEPRLTEHTAMRWVSVAELPALDFAPADKAALADIIRGLNAIFVVPLHAV